MAFMFFVFFLRLAGKYIKPTECQDHCHYARTRTYIEYLEILCKIDSMKGIVDEIYVKSPSLTPYFVCNF